MSDLNIAYNNNSNDSGDDSFLQYMGTRGSGSGFNLDHSSNGNEGMLTMRRNAIKRVDRTLSKRAENLQEVMPS